MIGSLAPQAWLCWPLGIKRAAVLMVPVYRALEGSPKEGGQFAHKSGQLSGHTPRQKLHRYAHESSAQTRNTVYIRIYTRRKDTRMTVANTYRSLTRLNHMSIFNLQKTVTSYGPTQYEVPSTIPNAFHVIPCTGMYRSFICNAHTHEDRYPFATHTKTHAHAYRCLHKNRLLQPLKPQPGADCILTS